MQHRTLTPSINVTIGRHTRVYFAYLTTAPADLDSPATVTLHASTFADVAGITSLGALPTEPKDGEMVQVRGEAEVAGHTRRERVQVGMFQLLDVAAARADQVMVGRLGRPLVDGVTRAHVCHSHEAHAAKHVERAADRLRKLNPQIQESEQGEQELPPEVQQKMAAMEQQM